MNAEIQMHDTLRNELAAKTAEFEAMRGTRQSRQRAALREVWK